MLFQSTEEIRQYLPVSSAIDFENLKPHIIQIENDFIKPLLGSRYEIVNTYYNDGQSSDFLPELISAAQNAIIHLAYWRGFDVLNAYISDGGFKRSESDKVKSLFKYQEDNLREYFKTIGFNALDSMLERLEKFVDHITNNGGIDEDWYIATHDDFINNAKQFSEIYEINGSRLVFLRLKKYMKQVKDLQLKPLLGNQNWEYLLAEFASPVCDFRVKQIVPYIQMPLVFLAVALLMEDSGADLTDKGLVYDGKISANGGDVAKIPAEKERVAQLIARNKKIGESYMNQLKQYLIDNATTWNDYAAQASGVVNRDNMGKKSFWV
jgi:hypothetical protein